MKEEKQLCIHCNGSGEGMYDGSVCTECKGKGTIDNDLNDDDYE